MCISKVVFVNIYLCGQLTAYFAAYSPQRTMILMISLCKMWFVSVVCAMYFVGLSLDIYIVFYVNVKYTALCVSKTAYPFIYSSCQDSLNSMFGDSVCIL